MQQPPHQPGSKAMKKVVSTAPVPRLVLVGVGCCCAAAWWKGMWNGRDGKKKRERREMSEKRERMTQRRETKKKSLLQKSWLPLVPEDDD